MGDRLCPRRTIEVGGIGKGFRCFAGEGVAPG